MTFDTSGVPEIGRLAKLRGCLPLADSIFGQAKGIEITDGKVLYAAIATVSATRRALDKRIDALGIPRKAAHASDFPEGCGKAAEASAEFWVALEVAMSAVAAVNEAERAVIDGAG